MIKTFLTVFAIIAVFIAGLMVGRTPEYLGKKIESRDAYFKALPKLVEQARHAEESVAEGWEELQKARGEPARKKVQAKLRKRETVLRASFGKFFFKLKVYEEYLEQMRPVLEEIETLL